MSQEATVIAEVTPGVKHAFRLSEGVMDLANSRGRFESRYQEVPMCAWMKCFCVLVLFTFSAESNALTYWTDSETQIRYRSAEEACTVGVVLRTLFAAQEADTTSTAYRYTAVALADEDIGERFCNGVIQRRLPSGQWVLGPQVDQTSVYESGAAEPCVLGGAFLDSETGQCGPPKCTDQCCGSGCGNGTNPIQTASGNKHQVETDFVGAGPFPLVLSRTYDSKRTWRNNSVPMGVGWTHRYMAQVYAIPDSSSNAITQAIVYRPDGRILRFHSQGTSWVSDADVSEKLSVMLGGASGSDFAGATFTTNDDERESYDQLGRLTSITNRDGFVQTLSYTTGSTLHNSVQAVSDPLGRTLAFGYDAVTGRLTTVTDGNGAVIQYGYDGNGNLTTVTYPDAGGLTKTRTYLYNEGSYTGGTSWLTGIQDENNQRFASWTYLNDGRAWANLSVHGALSPLGTIDKTSLSFNADGTTTVTDALGQARNFSFKVSSLVARFGGLDQACDYCGTHDASRDYDTNGYPKTATDFRGHQTIYSFNARGLEEVRDEAKTLSEERITNTTWNTTFRVPNTRSVTKPGAPTAEARTDWHYNTRGQPDARCDYDLTVSGASGYTCSPTNPPVPGIRRWTYTYCDAVNTNPADAIGSAGESLAKDCPKIGLLRRINGPRTDIANGHTILGEDWTTYQYYTPVTDGSVPPKWIRGDLSSVVNAAGHATQFLIYDSNGRVLRMSDANGVITDMTYHPRGWLLTRTVRANAAGTPDPGDATTTLAYDGVGNLVQTTLPDGSYRHFVYDNAHRLTDIYDSATPGNYLQGNRVHYTLDNLGNRSAEDTYDTGGVRQHTLSRTYDTLDRLTKLLNAGGLAVQAFVNPTDPPPTGTTYTNGYDGNGNVIYSVDDMNTGGMNVGALRQYDGLNRLMAMLQDHTGTGATSNTTTQYTYDTRDNLRSVTDPDSVLTTYVYDGLNNLSSVASHDSGTTTYTYDAAGNRKSMHDARNVITNYSYDALNRVTDIVYPATGTLNVHYGYDEADTVTGCSGSYAKGRLTSMSDYYTGRTIFCYDQRGNVTVKRNTLYGGALSYAYTLADRLASVTYPNGDKVTYGYDTVGRASSVSYQPSGGATTSVVDSVAYYPFGPVNLITFHNGRKLSKFYDLDYAIDQVISTAADGLLIDATPDVLGNLKTASSAVGASPPTRSFQYDPLYRLTGVTDASSASLESYSYNRTGDRLSKTLAGQSTQTYSYGTPLTSHQLQSVAGVGRTYDQNGNTTGRGDNSLYTYSDANRLAEVCQPLSCPATTGTTHYSYFYNGLGQRTLKQTLSMQTLSMHPFSTTSYAYDERGQLLYELAPTGATDYLYLDGLPVSVVVGGQIYYVETDQLGTPREVANTSNGLRWKWDYFGTTFGETAPNQNPSGLGSFTFNLRFPGQYFDAETGNHYNYFRDYELQTGRYLQTDRIGLDGGLNTYAYVGNNPISDTDPFGLFRYNKPPPDTVPLPPGMEAKVACIENCIGIPLVVTGGAEKQHHSRNSLHYSGHAVDFGFNSNPGLRTRAADVFCCAIKCDLNYGAREGPPRYPDQIHLQDIPGNGINQPISPATCSPCRS